jgi:hypothetical protein
MKREADPGVETCPQSCPHVAAQRRFLYTSSRNLLISQRNFGAQGRNRTTDTVIFSHVLCALGSAEGSSAVGQQDQTSDSSLRADVNLS